MSSRTRARARTRARLQVAVLLSWLPVLAVCWTIGATTGDTVVASTIAAFWTGIVFLVLIRTLETP